MAANPEPTPNIAAVAAMAADPTRAQMLSALMGGRALTAGELARAAWVTPQTCSGHLAKLTQAGFIEVAQQGRYRYYRLANLDVAVLLEALQVVAAAQPRVVVTGPGDADLRRARACYDHLAGALGVALMDRLQAMGWVEWEATDLRLTSLGRRDVEKMGISMGSGGCRPHCRACMDWSERRMHLSGKLGADLLQCFLERDWLRRRKESRALQITGHGRNALRELFGLFDA